MNKLMFKRSRKLVSWSMREFGLGRPDLITPEFVWHRTAAARLMGVAIGVGGGTLSYQEHKQALPALVTVMLSVFGKSSASKTLEAFIGELLSPTIWMAALLILTFLVGVSRIKNGGLDRTPSDTLTRVITGCYVTLQGGLMFVATVSASFASLAVVTGHWRSALGFLLVLILAAMHAAVVWSVLRMMFVLSDDDNASARSRGLGLLLVGVVIGMPKLIPMAERMESLVKSLTM
ncbi:MAG: hypothetical protein HY836_12735 [Aquabacterium sp.]|uniref:hypothetical protein n=1 Tax=Aquabacterium sp. TaxID=1872578 RepID=UPI0025C4C0AD|nr:hypothetical protein [Aquabacterium sp.]MBI5926448.1 hypothetical protein [Aquabacterium sp.]